MKILLTNDDGYDAPGLRAAFEAIHELGAVHVVAPRSERSTCSHRITLNAPITVERIEHERFGVVHAVDGTPADCVRLALSELLKTPLDLVVSGINRGANSGVDIFYSGTVAGAREAAIFGIPSMAFSQSVRNPIEVNWQAASDLTSSLVRHLLQEKLPGPGFWNVNYPSPIPADPMEKLHRVPIAATPAPARFTRTERDEGRVMEFQSVAGYWIREARGVSDYTVLRDGGITITAVPLNGSF